ncbi:MAG TPA: phosphomannomutase/phosphoglucomutase, partial [Cycloclasticus sp.]|nr:phosphomannomutase/phosphoglucomutase [Cycloclasticus sp.]
MVQKIILVLMVLVIAAGGAGYVYLGQIEQQNIEEAEQLKARVQKAASVLSLKVKKWRQSVGSLAQDPVLIESLKTSEQALLEWVDGHGSSVDDMIKLRVIRPGLMHVDRTVSPPLGYAGLELIRKAEASKKTQMPEVHMMGSDARHIAVVAPVMDVETSLAVVLSSLNVDAIQKTFKSALSGEQDGWLLLKQGGLRIASSGAPSHQSGLDLAAVQVVGTRWRITIKQRPVTTALTRSKLMAYVVASLIGILLLGVLVSILMDQDKRKKLGTSIKKRIAKKKKGESDAIEEVEPLFDEEAFSEQAIAKVVMANMEKGPKQMANMEKGPKQMANMEKGLKQMANPIFMKDDGIEVEAQTDVPQSIFRAYDIRGIVDETLTEQGVFSIGRAVATEALSVGQKTIAIARDGRLHSPRLSESLAKGIQSTGCHVVDVGQVPTPVLYFATHQLDTQSGVMITGSHNPANYNGLKIVIAGNTLSGDAIQNLYKRIERDDFEDGEGSYQQQMMLPEYIGAITADVRLGRMMKVVVDCGNGVAGEAAPMLLSTLGCEVVPLYCDIDGNFPNHHPDPSKPENLQELIDKVREEEAELGLAFDGDGDRLGVVDSS